jgi:hypothetical protein
MRFVEGFIVCGKRWGALCGFAGGGLLIFIFGLSLFLHLDLDGLFPFIEVHAWCESLVSPKNTFGISLEFFRKPLPSSLVPRSSRKVHRPYVHEDLLRPS